MGAANDNYTQTRLHLKAIARKEGKCERCPPHGGENRKRPDRHRSKPRKAWR